MLLKAYVCTNLKCRDIHLQVESDNREQKCKYDDYSTKYLGVVEVKELRVQHT